MKRIVVDASVAVKWVVAENLRDEARSLIRFHDRLLAPDLIFPELANICWRKVRAGEMLARQAPLVIAAVRTVIRDIRPTAGYAERALAMALTLGHPAYDAIYLACAEAAGAVLVTADSRLVRKIDGTPLAPLVAALDDPALALRIGQGQPAIRLETLEKLAVLAAAAAEVRGQLTPPDKADSGPTFRKAVRPGHEREVRNAPMSRIERLVEGLSQNERGELLALLWAARDVVELPAESTKPWLDRRAAASRHADNIPYIMSYAILPALMAKAVELLRS